MLTIDEVPSATLTALREVARVFEIKGRSKMSGPELESAVRDALGVREAVPEVSVGELLSGDEYPAGVPVSDVATFAPGDASCVTCREGFNLNDTPVCPSCVVPAVATPATVFGGKPRNRFKVTRTDSRFRQSKGKRRRSGR